MDEINSKTAGSWVGLDLSKLSSVAAVKDNLPSVGNYIYSFHVNITSFAKELRGKQLCDKLKLLCSTNFMPKWSSPVGPYHEVDLIQTSNFSGSFLNQDRSIELLTDPDFSKTIRDVLIALQERLPPLYVGQTSDIQDRVGRHLSENSTLKNRLAKVEIDIHNTWLCYCKVDTDISFEVLMHHFKEAEISPDDFLEEADEPRVDEATAEAERRLFPDRDFGEPSSNAPTRENDLVRADESNQSTVSKEKDDEYKRQIIEEIVTRLTHPGFTRKVGNRDISGME